MTLLATSLLLVALTFHPSHKLVSASPWSIFADNSTSSSSQYNDTFPSNTTTSTVSASSTGSNATSANVTFSPYASSLANATASSVPSANVTSSALSSSTTSYTSGNDTTPSSSSITYYSPDVPAPLNLTYAYNSPKWAAAHQKAAAYLSNWTIEEKVILVTGVGWENGRCVGNIAPIPSRNFSGLCLEDSPLGVRFTDFSSAFPAGINTATTFDKDLMYARGYAMGKEHKGKGVNIALGPMTNMGRVAAGGRNWEGFGADPYLSGWATEMTIRGMQDAGVQATVKHYIGNEQERNRTTSSSNIDDRTLREIYTHPFLRAVHADVASVMCSYNLVNGSWACQNSEILNQILKTEFGFQGYVMSDWNAQHSGVLSANSGLDMTMPGDIVMNDGLSYWGANLTTSVNNGSVTEERLSDMAQRIIAGWYLLGQDQNYPAVNFDAFRRTSEVNNSHVDVQDDHWKLIQHIGAASTVLLKNENNALPLKRPRTIALIGSDMGPSLQGPNGYSDRGGDDGTLAMGWGSGSTDFPYLVDPLQAISLRARHDRTSISWWLKDFDLTGAQTTASNVEVALVGINSDSGEGYITVDGNEGDRNNLTAWHGGDPLVQAVAAVNNNTIVVVHSVGPIIMESWIEHPNITAVLWAGLPGQESGNSLVDVLYGSYNPSGRLPYTIAKNRSDYSADIIYVNSSIPETPQVNYTEGLNIDYRHFLSANITPRYEFGFGLSYTSFNFSKPEVKKIDYGHSTKRDWEVETNGTQKAGRFLAHSLQMPRWTISATITNTGEVNGCEVPQLYISYPEGAGEPPKVLRDFARINLDPTDSTRVSFNLSRYDLSIWDVVRQDWVIPNGTFTYEVGKSSMDNEAIGGKWCPTGHC